MQMYQRPSPEQLKKMIDLLRSSPAVRALPARLNDARPDNRVQTARILLHLLDFIKWFMLDRVARDGWAEDPNDRSPPIKITAVLKRADKVWDRLRRAHIQALGGAWQAQPAVNFKCFGSPKVMGGSVGSWQRLVQRHILNSFVEAGDAEFCIVHDAWFEKGLMASVGLNKSYVKKLVLADSGALAVAMSCA